MTNLESVCVAVCRKYGQKGREILRDNFYQTAFLNCVQAAAALLCSKLHKPFSQVGVVLLKVTNHVRLFFQDFVQVIIVPKRWNLKISQYECKIVMSDQSEMPASLCTKYHFIRQKSQINLPDYSVKNLQ